MIDRDTGEVRRYSHNSGDSHDCMMFPDDDEPGLYVCGHHLDCGGSECPDARWILASDHDEVVAGKDAEIGKWEAEFNEVMGCWHKTMHRASGLDDTVACLDGERDELRVVLGLMAGGVGRTLAEEAQHQLATLRAQVSELEGLLFSEPIVRVLDLFAHLNQSDVSDVKALLDKLGAPPG